MGGHRPGRGRCGWSRRFSPAGGRAVAEPRCTAVAGVSGAPVAGRPGAGACCASAACRWPARAAAAPSARSWHSEEERVRVTIIDGDGRVVERAGRRRRRRGDRSRVLGARRPARPAPGRARGAPARRLSIASRRGQSSTTTPAGPGRSGGRGGAGRGGAERRRRPVGRRPAARPASSWVGPDVRGALARYAVDTESQGGLASTTSRTARPSISCCRPSCRSPSAAATLRALPGGRRSAWAPSAPPGRKSATSASGRGDRARSCAASRPPARASPAPGTLRLDLSLGWAPLRASGCIGEIRPGPINDEPPLAGAPTWLSALGLGLVYGGL